MLKISGLLSELFKNNEIDITITDELCESMINKPIVDKNENVIGAITY